MTHADLLAILVEAERRVEESEFLEVRNRSRETIDLCLERMRREGIDRETLERLAANALAKGRAESASSD